MVDQHQRLAGADLAVIYVTSPTRDEALALARKLVEERLLACANLFDGATSVYWWEEQVQQSSEVIVIGKTRAELVPRVMERVQTLHSYDCPCVVSWKMDDVHAPYAAWLRQETAAPDETTQPAE